MTGSPTAALAGFAATLTIDDVPDDVRAHARRCLLDTVGCALFGSSLRWTRILANTVREVDSGGPVTLWGFGSKVSAPHAALVNGTAVHAFELDDLHRRSIVHPGSVVSTAAMAAAELVGGVSGGAYLAAVIAGYEVAARVGMSVGTAHLLAGWHPTGTHGTLAAAAAAGSILGLDADQLRDAFGIAGSQSSGLMAAQYGAMVKRLHAGRAAQSGLYAALLAQKGFTGISELFESEYGGYCTTFSPTHSLDALTEGLGSKWETATIGFKPYATNGSCHPSIDIVHALQTTERFRPEEVDEVIVHASTATVQHVGWPYVPDSVTTAQMNLPYILAVLMTDGEAFVDQFDEDRIADPRLVELSRRVRVLADPAIDARGDSARHATRIEIRLRDGRALAGERDHGRGSSACPLTEADVRTKYETLAAKVLPLGQVRTVEALVERIETLEDVRALADQLAGSPAVGRTGTGPGA